MSAAVLTVLLVLQVFSACGTSLVLNGAVGESIVLPTDEKGPIRGQGFMEWKKNSITVIKLVIKLNGSIIETTEIDKGFKGRLTVNHETGALNISDLSKQDSGEYVFRGIVSTKPFQVKTVLLQVYERILSVWVTSQLNNNTDSSSCNMTLSCSVTGASQAALFWSRNGQNIMGAENRTTLTVSPTYGEEIYTCMATNPISSQSYSVTSSLCQIPGISSSLYIYIAAGVGGFLVMTVVVITLLCILKKSKRGQAQEDITVYAEIGEKTNMEKSPVYSQPPQPADGTPSGPSTVYDMVKLDRTTATQYQEVL